MWDLLFGNRFDFLGLGPASTNRSAAVLACALVSCAYLFLHDRRQLQWAGLLLGAGLAVLLIATKSRGGMIAAACGLGFVGWVLRPRVSRGVLIVGAFTVAALIVYGALNGFWGRFSRGDDSRSDLWCAGLAMLWDVPRGVGVGNAADFYEQWYQEIGDRRGYLSLINYHFNWLAERGVGARLAYALGWAALAWLVWPRRASSFVTTAAAVWLTFFVAAVFSTTANAWQVWTLPVAWLAALIVWRMKTRVFASTRSACRCGAAALFSLSALHAAGWCLSSPQLSTGPHVIEWGEGPPLAVVYAPNPGVLGEKWGHDLRGSGTSAIVLHPGADIPLTLPSDSTWVVSGVRPERLPPGSNVRLFNLPGAPETLAWLTTQCPANVQITLSDSLCRELRCEDWFGWSDRYPEIARVKIMGGVNLFIPSWSWFDGD